MVERGAWGVQDITQTINIQYKMVERALGCTRHYTNNKHSIQDGGEGGLGCTRHYTNNKHSIQDGGRGGPGVYKTQYKMVESGTWGVQDSIQDGGERDLGCTLYKTQYKMVERGSGVYKTLHKQ